MNKSSFSLPRLLWNSKGKPGRETQLLHAVTLALLCIAVSACYPRQIEITESPPITLRLVSGTSKTLRVRGIDNARNLRDVRLEIFRFGGWHGTPLSRQNGFVAHAHPDGPDSILLRVETGSGTPAGDYRGQFVFLLGPKSPEVISIVDLEVVPSKDVSSGHKIIPVRPAYPSSDRIIKDDNGQLVVRDELNVLLALKTPFDNIAAAAPDCGANASCFTCPPLTLSSGKKLDDEELEKLTPFDIRKISKGGIICAIANLTGAEFLGSVPEAKVYQLRFPEIDSPRKLAEKRKQVLKLSDAFPELIAVSRSFVGVSLPAISANDYSDNAAAFNTIGVNTPDGAWEKATVGETPQIPGNPAPDRIPVAVIDADFRAATAHQDFVGSAFNNVGYVSETAAASPLNHGMRVSGLIGARGNNSLGIAGLIWDVDLRLYDFNRGHVQGSMIPPAIHLLEAMVRAIDNKRLCDPVGCGDNELFSTDANLLYPRIVNLSVDFHRFGTCVDATESNAILGQGVLYGLRQNTDILWVAAAGNGNKDAGCEAPAGLTGPFPLNTMTVAAVGTTGSSPADAEASLWVSSNHGPFVSIAAPGVGLRTLNEAPAGYVTSDGTSLAAPIVSGLAALIASQKPNYTARKIKQCIVQNADIDLPGHPFNVVNASASMPAFSMADCPVPPLPWGASKLDVVLSFDTTGSMRQEIDAVKTKACEIVNGILGAMNQTPISCPAVPPVDPDPGVEEVVSSQCDISDAVCFSVVSYEDYPASYDSSMCGTSAYSNPYGSASDKPFRTHLKLTADSSNVLPAISKLRSRSGADGPESYARAFWEVADSVGNAVNPPAYKLDFWPEANRNSLKVIINFGDNFPHDTNLNGSDLPCRFFDDGCVVQECPVGDLNCVRQASLRIPNPPEINPNDTGIDPGSDASISCGGDDIDLQEDAIMSLINNKVRLIHIDSSERADLVPYWSVWTQATGGAFAQIRTDGTSMIEAGSIELPQLILELLASIPVE